MPRSWFLRIPMFLAFAVVFAIVLGFGVMWLWNWLMPALFGLKTIGYWEAVALVVLSKILFGGFRGGHGGGPRYWRRRWMERWDQMTPEEREKFRAECYGRWGRWGRMEPPSPKPSA